MIVPNKINFSHKSKNLLHTFLPIIIFSSLFIVSASAENYQKLSLDEIDLGAILITAKRSGSREGSTAENIIVYTSEDIERSSARNLGEAIKYMHGVDISVTNEFGQKTSVTIHGSDSRQVLIMIDGIPFNTQLSGQADPSIIPIGNVERIEVIKGASSSAWGSSLGGVINVITKDVGDSVVPKGEFKTTFAEFSTTKNSIELSGKIAEMGYYVSGSYLETDGIKSRSDVTENKIFAKVSIPIADSLRIISSFGYTGAKVQDGVNPNGRWSSTPYISRYGKIKLDMDGVDHKFNVSYKYNDRDIAGDTYIASSGTRILSAISSNTYQGISLNGSMSFRETDALVYGSDFDWHVLKSTLYLSDSKSINMQAPYANYTFKWNDWDFIPGIRYDNNRQFGSQTSPSFGVIYHFDDTRGSLIRAKVSRAFNAPPLLWVYMDYPAWGVNPNPDLKAERATVYEIGFETKLFSSLRTELDLYRSDVKDAIAWSSGLSSYDNFNKFRRQGVEISFNYEVNDNLTLFTGGAFNDVENRETKATVRDADIARQSFSLGGTYENGVGFLFNLYGRYNRWSSEPCQANDRKFIFDARISQEFKDVKDNVDLEVFLNIHNLTNSKYWSNPTYPLPKRYFEGGFSLKF